MTARDKPEKTDQPAAAARGTKSDGDPPAAEDVVLLHSRTQDGQGLRALRARPGSDKIEVAEIRPMREGKPLVGTEVVSLHPRKEMPFVCDVEVQYDGRSGEGSRQGDGPPQVANASYRRNWGRVFGRRKRGKLPPPVDDGALN